MTQKEFLNPHNKGLDLDFKFKLDIILLKLQETMVASRNEPKKLQTKYNWQNFRKQHCVTLKEKQ